MKALIPAPDGWPAGEAFPPSGIMPRMFRLVDVDFVPHPHATTRIEQAYRGAERAGEVLLDLVDSKGQPLPERRWLARKYAFGGFGEWKPMRCVHEARAFIVSKVRQ